MQSRGPGWWVLYSFAALCAFMLAGRLVAMIFSSFFSLLIVEQRLESAGADNSIGTIQAVRRLDMAEESDAPPPVTIPGAARPLTAADLKKPAPPYLETPAMRRKSGK